MRVGKVLRTVLREIQIGLPPLSGSPIRIYAGRKLRAHRGKLRSGAQEPGNAIYATSFVRKREIVFDEELVEDVDLLRLIFVHELFHFVWPRLSNRARSEFGRLIAREVQGRTRGELGESAEVGKSALATAEVNLGSRAWREYVCESFCDTAAWLYAGVSQHSSFRLAERWKKRREEWFKSACGECWRC